MPPRSRHRLGRPPPGPRDAAAHAPTAERSERPTGTAGTRSGLTPPPQSEKRRLSVAGALPLPPVRHRSVAHPAGRVAEELRVKSGDVAADRLAHGPQAAV